MKLIVNEGAFTEDSLAAGYLGGVLASSKTGVSRDDRGVTIGGLVSRLSVFQLRLHCVCYLAAHRLLRGTRANFTDGDSIHNRIAVGPVCLLIAMGFTDEELHDERLDVQAAISHAFYGLHKEELIVDWEIDWRHMVHFSPTPLGAELFLWASGIGHKQFEFVFDKAFEPFAALKSSIPMAWGRGANINIEDGKSVTEDGFDYSYDERRWCNLMNVR